MYVCDVPFFRNLNTKRSQHIHAHNCTGVCVSDFVCFVVSMRIWNSTRTMETIRIAECWRKKNVSVKQCVPDTNKNARIQSYAVGTRTQRNAQNEPIAMDITTTPTARVCRVFLNAPYSNSSFCFSFQFMCICVLVCVNARALVSFSLLFLFFTLIFARCTYIFHTQLVEQTMSKSLKLVCTSSYRLASIRTLFFAAFVLSASLAVEFDFLIFISMHREIRSDQLFSVDRLFECEKCKLNIDVSMLLISLGVLTIVEWQKWTWILFSVQLNLSSNKLKFY